MLGLQENSLFYGQVAVERGTGVTSILRLKGQLTLQGEPSGFNSCKGVIEIDSGFNSREGAMSRKPFYYFIPSLVAIVRGI